MFLKVALDDPAVHCGPLRDALTLSSIGHDLGLVLCGDRARHHGGRITGEHVALSRVVVDIIGFVARAEVEGDISGAVVIQISRLYRVPVELGPVDLEARGVEIPVSVNPEAVDVFFEVDARGWGSGIMPGLCLVTGYRTGRSRRWMNSKGNKNDIPAA